MILEKCLSQFQFSQRYGLAPTMTCVNCPAQAAVRVTYGSNTIEPAEVNLCLNCSFQLHQEMLGHLMWLGGWIEEAPLEESVTHA
jgi:hypothetical protein